MTRAVGWLCAATLVVDLGTASADCDFDDKRWGLALQHELTAVRDVDPGPSRPDFHDLVLAGFHVDGMLGPARHCFTAHAVLEATAGATVHTGGFAYDVALLPFGIGELWGDNQMVGVAAGVGEQGAVGTMRDITVVPVEAFAELAPTKHVRLLGRVRVGPVVEGGSGHALDAMLGVRIGRRMRDDPWFGGRGYFVAAAYRELLGARFVGLVIGHSLDFASHSNGLPFDPTDPDP